MCIKLQRVFNATNPQVTLKELLLAGGINTTAPTLVIEGMTTGGEIQVTAPGSVHDEVVNVLGLGQFRPLIDRERLNNYAQTLTTPDWVDVVKFERTVPDAPGFEVLTLKVNGGV